MPKQNWRTVLAGKGNVKASELVDSTNLWLDCPHKLRGRFEAHGYVFVRGLIDRQTVCEVSIIQICNSLQNRRPEIE